MGQVKKSEIPKRAGMTDKSISTGIKYWVCVRSQVHHIIWQDGKRIILLAEVWKNFKHCFILLAEV
jgi:S-adenosylhomocysteine hydrolase